MQLCLFNCNKYRCRQQRMHLRRSSSHGCVPAGRVQRYLLQIRAIASLVLATRFGASFFKHIYNRHCFAIVRRELLCDRRLSSCCIQCSACDRAAVNASRSAVCGRITATVCCLQVEKYRPSLIKDIVGNTEAVARLQVIADEGNMPNLILSVRPRESIDYVFDEM